MAKISAFKQVLVAVGLGATTGFCLPALASEANDDEVVEEGFDPHDIAGVWVQKSPSLLRDLPYTPEYAQIQRERREMAMAGKPFMPQGTSCVPGGLVRTLSRPVAPIEIATVHENRFIITKEDNSIFRVYLDRDHLPEDQRVPSLFGDSVAHWEGDTLKVETIGLGQSVDLDGEQPHSPALEVDWTLRRVSKDEMVINLTMNDPLAFTEQVELEVRYDREPDWELGEYYCTDDRIDPETHEILPLER